MRLHCLALAEYPRCVPALKNVALASSRRFHSNITSPAVSFSPQSVNFLVRLHRSGLLQEGIFIRKTLAKFSAYEPKQVIRKNYKEGTIADYLGACS